MSRIRVLIADDHGVLRAGLQMLINAQPDMEVVGMAATVHEVVRAAAALRPDVLTLDLSLPDGSGRRRPMRMPSASWVRQTGSSPRALPGRRRRRKCSLTAG